MKEINDFYQLSIKANQKSSLTFIAREDKGFDPLRFYSGKVVDDWPSGITFRFSWLKQDVPEDMLDGGLHWWLVSNKFRLTCKENSIIGVQFLPVVLVTPTAGSESLQYWTLNVTQEISALDYEKTTWSRKQTKEKDQYPLLNVLNPVFQKEKLLEVDIFRLRIGSESGTTIYVSNKLKGLLKNNHADTGVWFGKIHVT